jgi:hypothetical protein
MVITGVITGAGNALIPQRREGEQRIHLECHVRGDPYSLPRRAKSGTVLPRRIGPGKSARQVSASTGRLMPASRS